MSKDMDLETFITQTINSVVSGVGKSGKYNDNFVGSFGENEQQFLEFDIAVSITNESGKGAKIGVVSTIASLGASKKERTEDIQHSRVKFKVPLLIRDGSNQQLAD